MNDEAMKHDQGKNPLHLVDPLFINGLAEVLGYGAKKYAAWNWAKGTFDHSRLYSAAMRHLMAYWSGEDKDPETGISHLYHAGCNLMFLARYAENRMGQDDRHLFGAEVVDRAFKALDTAVSGPRVYRVAEGGMWPKNAPDGSVIEAWRLGQWKRIGTMHDGAFVRDGELAPGGPAG